MSTTNFVVAKGGGGFNPWNDTEVVMVKFDNVKTLDSFVTIGALAMMLID